MPSLPETPIPINVVLRARGLRWGDVGWSHPDDMPDAIYDEAFYDINEGGSYRSAKVVLGLALSHLQPQSVLDVGCGVGTWLRAARELGAVDLLGIDGAYIDTRRFHVDPGCFAPADLSDPEALAAAIGGRGFDVAFCLETAEHLPAGTARAFVSALAGCSDVILWSAALPGQGGTHHVNERPLTYWASLWREVGFRPVDVLRPGLQFTSIDLWYAQNAILFVRDGKVREIEATFVTSYEERFGFVPPLAFMHPTAASPWLGLAREDASRKLASFATAFAIALADEVGLSPEGVARQDFSWDGHVAWVGLRPAGEAGLQPWLLAMLPHGTMLKIGLYFPVWQASDEEVERAKRRAETGGLIWNDPFGYALDGWAELGTADLTLRLGVSVLEGRPDTDLSTAREAAREAATLWKAYFESDPHDRPLRPVPLTARRPAPPTMQV